VLVLLEMDGVTLDFVRDDGTVLGKHTFSSGGSTYLASTGAAGRFWYVGASDRHLHAVTPDGTDSDVAPLADIGGSNFINGLAVRNDGQQWAWGVLETGASGPTRIHIDVAGTGVATRKGLDQATDNPILMPLAWTPRGIVVSRSVTGIGGCCYLTPETAGRDVMLVDPSTLQVTTQWTACSTAAVSERGSFACIATSGGVSTGVVTVHRASGSDTSVNAIAPVEHVGWLTVDDDRNNVLFAVVHSSGAGGGDGPYVIDTERADLAGNTVTKLFDQTTPDVVLPDGRVVVTSAPQVVNGSSSSVFIRSSGGSSLQIGPTGAGFLTSFRLTS
jgi:hypothetical protein